MLTSADQALIRRDPALPGLALLLDPQAFVAELARWRPRWASARARLTYLRYKPGRSCLAGFCLELDGECHHWQARAHRPEAREKLAKYRHFAEHSGVDTADLLLLDDLGLVLGRFPFDRQLKVLTKLADPARRRGLLANTLAQDRPLEGARLELLRYKPERRYVGRLHLATGEQALLKACTGEDFPRTLAGSRAFACRGRLRVPRLLGHNARHGLVVSEWLPGRPLDETMQDPALALEAVGAALLELHRQQTAELEPRTRAAEIEQLKGVTEALSTLCPELGRRLAVLAAPLGESLAALPERYASIHGDLHIEQILLDGDWVALIDFDQAVWADPMADLGSFLAQLHCAVIKGELDEPQRRRLAGTLLAGYGDAGGRVEAASLALYVALGLAMRVLEPFRQRWPDWPTRTAELLGWAENALAGAAPDADGRVPGHDPALPLLGRALDATVMAPLLAEIQPGIRLRGARLRRHKAGRRALIEYDVTDGSDEAIRPWLGKLRAKGLDRRTFELQRRLHDSGFDDESSDGISVPRPLGALADPALWLQERVPGETLTARWHQSADAALARRVAEAIHKLHRANVATSKTHGLDDELAILRRRLTALARTHHQGPRILAVLDGCQALADTMTPSPACGIHRDFYPDQVIVDGERFYLLDLDLYCRGDPALDVGNFIAHLLEYGRRVHGDISAYAEAQRALSDRFLELDTRVSEATLRAWVTLSLARHIAISAELPGRGHATAALIDDCQRRLEHHHG